MVLLTTFLSLLVLGLVVVGLGYVAGYPEIGVIGGVIILGAGGMVLITDAGLLVQTGQIEVTNTTTNTTTIEHTYDTVTLPQQLGIGGLVMVLGGTLILRSFDEFSQQ